MSNPKMFVDDFLAHYASPYYDPVKAHEYYMRTRELKGRRSTAGLNDEGKAAAKYVKEQLTSERKAKVEEHKNRTNTSIQNLRDQTTAQIEQKKELTKNSIERFKTHTQSQIDQLKAHLKSMSKEDKPRNSESIRARIASLRGDISIWREQLNGRLAEDRTGLREKQKSGTKQYREEHKTERTRLKDEYDAKYESELDRIRNTKAFQRQTKTRKKK